MAPFAFLNHHSFRRGASSQLTSVPESGAAQPTTTMGGIPSKVGPHVNEAPHKKLRPRSSSLNLLKRTRTPSGQAAARASIISQPNPVEDTTIVGASDSEAGYTRLSSGRRSGSESTVKTLSGSVHSHKSLGSNKDYVYDSDTSSTGTATRVTPPSEDQQELITHVTDEESSGMSTPVPPPPPKTPQIMLPTPSILPEDSPTKYGLRVAHTPTPDRSLTDAQRQKMTGAGLFVHAATQQKSATLALSADQAKSGAVDPNHLFARSSPSLPLSDRTNILTDPPNSLPSRKLRPNLYSPFKEAPQEHVAHALPLRKSQQACYRSHDLWQRMGSNYKYPVACAVCDGYEAPADDFMTCLWCEVHVCGRCHSEFVSKGVGGMMARQQKR